MREKDSYLQLRISQAEKLEIQKAAYKEGKKVSQYIIDLHRMAQKVCPCCGKAK